MLKAGAASCEITNDLGTDIQGATVGGKAEYVRDPLEANALLLKGENTAVLFISCDLGGLEPEVNHRARAAAARAANLPEHSVLIGSTHTGGPSIIPTNYRKAVDNLYLDRLVDWLGALAGKAAASLQPTRLRIKQGQARIGYNRRYCWADGTHTMFGDASREDFVGLEGPDDPTHTAIGVETLDGSPIAVLHANTAHPCTFYGASFYSADYPGMARACLREAMGDIPVLYFNGCQGDICTEQVKATGETAERKLRRLGHLMAGETLRLLYEAPPVSDVPLLHAHTDLFVPVRLPEPNRLREARETLSRIDQGEDVNGMVMALAHGAVLLQERFGDTGEDCLPLHAVRLGDLVLFSQPCELFCRYGLDLRRRSPAPMIAHLGLTDGYHGYVPTPTAINSGGYSAEPIYWTRLAPEAGDRIVDAGVKLIGGV